MISIKQRKLAKENNSAKENTFHFWKKLAPAYDTSHRNSTDGSVVWGRTCPNHDKSRRISRYALFRPNFTVRFRAMFTVQGIRPDFTVRFRAMFTVYGRLVPTCTLQNGHACPAHSLPRACSEFMTAIPPISHTAPRNKTTGP